ncbi:hypothetical protein KAR91_32790 [Candidatus Pacearchaeota archaeon]|nr:hypothetical protein [Candidatus Pacearchaeota archaeon]
MKKIKVGIYLDRDVKTKLVRAAYWDRESQTRIIDRALRKELKLMEKRHGKAYPEIKKGEKK